MIIDTIKNYFQRAAKNVNNGEAREASSNLVMMLNAALIRFVFPLENGKGQQQATRNEPYTICSNRSLLLQ